MSGAETTIDKWILSRLAMCVIETNAGMASYDFRKVTLAIHMFWLYEFCDVYLEEVKKVIPPGTPHFEFVRHTTISESGQKTIEIDEKKAKASREILYLCLDTFFRILAPIMPFITEELWQRLPKRPSEKAPSLCIASYPSDTDFNVFRNKEIEAECSHLLKKKHQEIGLEFPPE